MVDGTCARHTSGSPRLCPSSASKESKTHLLPLHDRVINATSCRDERIGQNRLRPRYFTPNLLCLPSRVVVRLSLYSWRLEAVSIDHGVDKPPRGSGRLTPMMNQLMYLDGYVTSMVH